MLIELPMHLKNASILNWDATSKCLRLLIQGQHILIAKVSPKNLSFYIPAYKPYPNWGNDVDTCMGIKEYQAQRLCTVSNFGPWNRDPNALLLQIEHTMERHLERYHALSNLLRLYACIHYTQAEWESGITVAQKQMQNHLNFTGYHMQERLEKNIDVGQLAYQAITRVHTMSSAGFHPYSANTSIFLQNHTRFSAHDQLRVLDPGELNNRQQRVVEAFPEIK